MEIVQERMRREFGVDIISTTPSVIFKVLQSDGKWIEVDNPVKLPDPSAIERIEEPMIKAIVIMLNEQVGDVMRLVMERRGIVEKTESLDGRRLILTCLMPLLEILTEFHDSLKSVTRGYGSMDYEHAGYQESMIVKMDILLNSEPIDAFSCMVHVDKAEGRGRRICETLKDVIPSHMFSLPVQAAIGKRIIARETIKAFRKDVTAKLYGGDITRKRKVLEKQKEGKRRMKQFGTVNVPQEAFVAVLKTI
jgi:GTP-binding protein LepA